MIRTSLNDLSQGPGVFGACMIPRKVCGVGSCHINRISTPFYCNPLKKIHDYDFIRHEAVP